MVVFLDLFFLENMIIDGFLLTLIMQTLKIRAKNLSLISASVFGAIYSMLYLFLDKNYIASIPSEILAAFIMNLILFGKRGFLFLLKSTVIFILYSILLAGMCFFIQLRFYGNSDFTLSISNYSLVYQLLSIMLIYILTQRIVVYIKDRRSVNKFIYDLEIEVKTFKKTVRGFLDTGNELREPVSNLPVIILEKGVLKNTDIDIDNYAKLLIPYSLIDGKAGSLKAFIPDSVKIKLDEKYLTCSVIIALCENKLSSAGDYNALLSRGVLYS